ESSGDIITVGALETTGLSNKTYVFNGGWSAPVVLASPGKVEKYAMTQDHLGVVILQGGQGPTGAPYNTTYSWNLGGLAWNVLTLGMEPSPPRYAHAMAPYLGMPTPTTVLFGGTDGTSMYGDTWLWNGSGWVFHLSVTVQPPPRAYHAMAY